MLDHAHAHDLLFDDVPDKVVVEPAPVFAPARLPDSSNSERPMDVCILTSDGKETWHRPVVSEPGITACELRFIDARTSTIDGTTSMPVAVRLRPAGYGGPMCTRCFLPFELRRGVVADAHAEGDTHPYETIHESARRQRTLEMPSLTVPPRRPGR